MHLILHLLILMDPIRLTHKNKLLKLTNPINLIKLAIKVR